MPTSPSSPHYIRETDGALMIWTERSGYVNLQSAYLLDLLTPQQKRDFPKHMDSSSARDARKTQILLDQELFA